MINKGNIITICIIYLITFINLSSNCLQLKLNELETMQNLKLLNERFIYEKYYVDLLKNNIDKITEKFEIDGIIIYKDTDKYIIIDEINNQEVDIFYDETGLKDIRLTN